MDYDETAEWSGSSVDHWVNVVVGDAERDEGRSC